MSAILSINRDGLLSPSGRAKRLRTAHAALDTQIIMDTNPYVPFRTGLLASSPFRSGKKVGEIIYDTPYAKRMYYGDKFNFSIAHHPQATSRWLEKSKALWKDKWRNLVKKILSRGGAR
ncbi:minor capsid protein [Deltaproteobacteria bacterium Smac51]|nr:minor capsid protein [Deltaproteobacteria bacterium Smac51]